MVVGAAHRPLVGPTAGSVRNADELKFQLVAVLLLAGDSPKHENDVPIPALDVLRAIRLRRNLDVTVEDCPGHRHIKCDPSLPIEFVKWVQSAINQGSIVDGLLPGVGRDQTRWPQEWVIDYLPSLGRGSDGLVLGAPGTVIGMGRLQLGQGSLWETATVVMG